MSIASIMVSLDLGPSAASRVRLAADLAGRFEATLTGVAARRIPGLGPVEDVKSAQAAYDKERSKLAAEFERIKEVFTRNVGPEVRMGWREAEGGAEAFLIQQARGADLAILGRSLSEEGRGAMAADPGAVLMEVGRPVLVVPPDLDHLKAARIVIAWKDAPEARRAVTAALPFVTHADQVYVVSAGADAPFEGAEEVSEFLARHGAHVTPHFLDVRAGKIADEIQRFASYQDADLVVMGGYGHSRLREWLFGGVTRDILRVSPLCCLMSH